MQTNWIYHQKEEFDLQCEIIHIFLNQENWVYVCIARVKQN